MYPHTTGWPRCRRYVDAEQVAYEFWGAMLGYHHASRLMRDPRAAERAAKAFETLVRAARADARPAPSRRVASRRPCAHPRLAR